MTTLKSYDLNGKKLSFANWISNLSPQETPFTSMTGKESINQTLFQWQVDSLEPAGSNAIKEGSPAEDSRLRPTTVKSNITQILRKTVKVSDTANALANYGRGKELQYQMEKAGSELKRDLEFAFLNNKYKVQGNSATPSETAGFRGLVAPLGAQEIDTGAVVHQTTATANTVVEKDIFNVTYNLYLAGSEADIIMFHPKWASAFSALQEVSAGGQRKRIFENTPKFSVYVSEIVDPLGQRFKLIPNRWMPEDAIYFFRVADWTQMVLRSPSRTKLSKEGSYEKWMLEMEVGLRHRHPFASGILETTGPATYTFKDTLIKPSNLTDGNNNIDFIKGGDAIFTKDSQLKLSMKAIDQAAAKEARAATTINAGGIKVYKNGEEVWRSTEQFIYGDQAAAPAGRAGSNTDWSEGSAKVIIPSLSLSDAGFYQVGVTIGGKEEMYPSCAISISSGSLVVDPLNS